MSLEQPNKEQTVLLQAMILYNDAKITDVIDGGGYTQGSDDVIIKVNRMAWGLFESTLLKAYKSSELLKSYFPEHQTNFKECSKCNGVGQIPFNEEEREKWRSDWNMGLEEDDEMYVKAGELLAKFCSPCQGTGTVLKPQG